MFSIIIDFEDGRKREVYENMTAREFGEFLVEWSKNFIMVYDTSFSEPSVRATIYMTALPR